MNPYMVLICFSMIFMTHSLGHMTKPTPVVGEKPRHIGKTQTPVVGENPSYIGRLARL